MPRYQQASTFDIVRSVKNTQDDVKQLQVQSSAQVRQTLNQVSAGVNQNGYFWGGDSTGWTATNGTFVVASDPPSGAPYPYAGLYSNNAISSGALMTGNNPFPVIPGQQYTVSAWVNSSATSVQIGFDFQDSSHTFTSGPTNPTITVTAGAWTLVTASLIAPGPAAYAYPRVGSPTADGAQTYVQAVTTLPTTGLPGAWQDMRGLLNSFVGTISGQYPPQYRFAGDGYVDVAGYIQTPSGAASNYNGVTFFTAPTAYRPNSNGGHQWTVTGANLVSGTAAPPEVKIDTSGNFQLHFIPTTAFGSVVIGIYGRYPLDSSGLILS